MNLPSQIATEASAEYRTTLQDDDQLLGDVVVLYGLQSIEERNANIQVQESLPGWFAIGDDSGGAALLMRLDGSHGVYRCGHGALGAVEPEPVAASFGRWHAEGCPLDNESPVAELPLAGDLWLVEQPAGGLKDLLALKSVLKLDNSLGELKQSLHDVPCRVARDIHPVAMAKRVQGRGDLAASIAFSDPGHSGPQYRVP